MGLTADDFGWATSALLDVAHQHCQGKLVSCLEGGYNEESLAACSRSHVAAMMDRRNALGGSDK